MRAQEDLKNARAVLLVANPIPLAQPPIPLALALKNPCF